MSNPAIEAVTRLLNKDSGDYPAPPEDFIAAVLDNMPRAEMERAMRREHGLSDAHQERFLNDIDAAISAARATLLPGAA